ncbi:MAG: carbohydrate kinase family protein [Acholeplasmataceae bacterium]
MADLHVNRIDEYPETGTLSLVDSITMHSGGCAVNVAIDLAKMGIDARLCAPLGNDIFGQFLKAELDRNRIDRANLITSDEDATSTSIVLINEAGERSFIHRTGINATFRKDRIEPSFLDDLDILLVTGVFLMDAFDRYDLALYLKTAKSRGIYTVVDTAWDPKDEWYSLIKDALPYIDLFMPSIDEAQNITGRTTPEDCSRWLRSKGAHDIVIKLGKKGSFALTGDQSYYKKPFLVENPVDTTGAGDAFVSGVIAGLSQSMDLEEAIILGNALGSYAVEAEGASSNIPSFAGLKKRVKGYE